MKYLYYLVALGSPHLEEKFDILSKNINYISCHLNCKIDVIINAYDSFDEIENFIKTIDKIDKFYLHNKSGILTELWLVNPYNIYISSYDYIFFILDDVEIIDLDIHRILEIKNKYKFDIISPKINNCTHYYLEQCTSGLAIANFLEFFFYIMNPEDFVKYALLNTYKNKYMWGVDWTFGHINFNVGIYYKNSVLHKFRDISADNSIKQMLMNEYLEQKFNLTDNYFITTYPTIKLYIEEENI